MLRLQTRIWLLLWVGFVVNPCYGASTVNFSTWMTDNSAILGEKTLAEISMPYSHDAGMYTSESCSGKNFFGSKCNTQTQQLTVGEQLKRGVRVFDLRPVEKSKDNFFTGHFSEADLPVIGHDVVGCHGGDMDSIFSDIASFAEKNPKELIILYFSHYYDQTTEEANTKMTNTSAMRTKLVKYVTDKLGTHLFKVPSGENITILKLKSTTIA